MSERRDRSNKPAEPKADDSAGQAPKTSGTAPADASLDLIAAVMAKAHGEAQGKAGGELKAHVADLVSQVKTVATIAAAENAAEDARQQAAAEMERLLDVMMRTGPKLAAALGPHRDAIAQQLQGFDIEALAQLMRLFADWMHKPDLQTEAQVNNLMSALQDKIGHLIGEDPVVQAEQRRAKIREGVAKNLDEIFKKPEPAADTTKPGETQPAPTKPGDAKKPS